MKKTPTELRIRDVKRAVEKLGCVLVDYNKHLKYKTVDNKMIMLPNHKNVKTATIIGALKIGGITKEQFMEVL